VKQQLPFDQVRVDNQTLSVDDFLALPVFKRVRFLLGGTLQLFRQGRPVAQTTELKALLGHGVSPAR
jgi:hypothetical protein